MGHGPGGRFARCSADERRSHTADRSAHWRGGRRSTGRAQRASASTWTASPTTRRSTFMFRGANDVASERNEGRAFATRSFGRSQAHDWQEQSAAYWTETLHPRFTVALRDTRAAQKAQINTATSGEIGRRHGRNTGEHAEPHWRPAPRSKRDRTPGGINAGQNLTESADQVELEDLPATGLTLAQVVARQRKTRSSARPERHGHGRAGKERRLRRPRCQSSRRHQEHA